MFNFSVHENFADELTEDRAKKLNEVFDDDDDKHDVASKLEVKSVKRTKKNKNMKLIKGVLRGKNEKASEEAFNKLNQWLESNYEVKLHEEKQKTPEIVQVKRYNLPTRKPTRKIPILFVLSTIIALVAVGLYYYLH